ncbi:MAG: glycosyltransferase family 4 protein [Planctomycetota bacterium]
MSGPREPLSVCLLSDVSLPSLGGAQTVLDCLARRLTALGHRPVVLAPPRREPGTDDYGYPLVRHRRMISKRFGTRLLIPRLLAMHRRRRFDLVHCHAAYPQAHVAASFRAVSGVPYVVRPHGSDILPGESIRRHPRLERRMRRAIVGADAVIAQGEFLRGVIEEVGVDPALVRVINNGVDLTEFADAAPHPHPRPYILSVGSLVPHKGFDVLIRGHAALPAGSPDLLLAGAGPEAGSLRRLAAELGVGDRVHLLGIVTGREKVALYRSAVCFVCPSRREPFANVILEAFASGLAVVATDVGGNCEMIRHGVNGLLVPADSPAAIAGAVRRLVGDPAALAALCAGARQTAVRYAWEAVADRYLELYHEVVGRVAGRRAA